jgi:hypothetical protein
MVSPLSATLAAVFVLGGITVGMTGGTAVQPAQPGPDMTNVWPTNQVYMGQRVVMTNGANWIIKRIVNNASGTTVEVRPNSTTTTNVKVTVPPESVGVPIWVLTVPFVIPDPIILEPTDPPVEAPPVPSMETPGPPRETPSEPVVPGEGG